MKSARLLLASCLGCKPMVESRSENNRRGGALIHPSDCMLWDFGLTPITSHEEGKGEEKVMEYELGHREKAVFMHCTPCLVFIIGPISLDLSLPPTLICGHSVLAQSISCFTLYVCVLIYANLFTQHPTLSLLCLSPSCLFVYSQSPHLFLSISLEALVNTPISVTTL